VLASQAVRGPKQNFRSNLVAGSGLSGLSGSSGCVVAVASGGARSCSSSGTVASASREANRMALWAGKQAESKPNQMAPHPGDGSG